MFYMRFMGVGGVCRDGLICVGRGGGEETIGGGGRLGGAGWVRWEVGGGVGIWVGG